MDNHPCREQTGPLILLDILLMYASDRDLFVTPSQPIREEFRRDVHLFRLP